MNGLRKVMLVTLVFGAVSTVLADEEGVQQADMTKRQSEVVDQQLPLKIKELKMNEALSGKRMPIKRWHAEFSPLGRRRAPLDVREAKEKTMVRPEVIETEKVDIRISSKSGRRAYVRNGEEVRKNELVAEYKNADVVTVKEASTPAGDRDEVSMRDLNRFSFQRNHSDSGKASVKQAGSEKKE